jgi:hypothetical protein
MYRRKAARLATELVNEPHAIDPAGELERREANQIHLEKQRRRGGRRSRDKGNRAERALVRFLQDHGFAAERVPLSGSAGGSYVGDLIVPLLGIDRTIEAKVRGNGFRELYAWLEGRDLLIVRADRREPLMVLPLKFAAEIAAAAERAKVVTP